MDDRASIPAAEGASAPLGPGSRALSLSASDGVRLRAALLDGRGRGLVLLLQGRTEYIEKYAPVAAELRARGFGVATLDWRGQGGSDRPVGHPRKGHVEDFAEYQRDLDALLDALRAQPGSALSGPRVMLAHSMGGAIGLRALTRGVEASGAVFSAPMWGLAQGRFTRWLGRGLARGAARLGLGRAYAPGGGDRTYVLKGFEGNVLTGDPAQFARLQALARARPELMLGGPTWGWVRAAYAEMDALRDARLDAPHLTLAGGDEAVTSLDAMRARSGDALRLFEGARHEPFFETEPIRARLWAEFDAFLARIGV